MIEHLLNGLTFVEFISYFFWALVGGALGILTEQFKFANPIERNGGFSLKFWFNANWKRFTAGVILMAVSIILQDSPSIESSIAIGISLDTILDRFINKKT